MEMSKRKMMKLYNLTDAEIEVMAKNIAEPAFELMKKKINTQLDIINKKEKDIHINSIINLVVAALSSLDANVLVMLRNLYKDTAKVDIDFVHLMNVYLGHVTSIMNHDELKRLKEKMN